MMVACDDWTDADYRDAVFAALNDFEDPPAPATSGHVAVLRKNWPDLAGRWPEPVPRADVPEPAVPDPPAADVAVGYRREIAEAERDAATVRKGPHAPEPPRGVNPSPGPEPLTLDLLPGPEFDAGDYDVPDLIRGVLTRGEPGQIVGPMKSCKTTVAIDLVLSLACARRFLGKFWVEDAVPAGLVSAESGRSTIQETARRVAASKGVTLADAADTYWGFDLPPLTDGRAPDALAAAIESRGLGLLVLDPLYLALGGGVDASNVFEMGKALKPIGEVCQRTGATVLLAHHARKNRVDHFAPLELHEIAYSGSAEWARQWLFLARRSRYDEVNGKHELWFGYGGSAGNAGLWGLDITEGHRSDDGGRVYLPELHEAAAIQEDVRGAKAAAREERREAETDAKLAGRAAKVRRYLAEHPEGDTENRILSGIGMSATTGRPVLLAMKAAEELVPTPVVRGNRKKPYLGWRLAPGGGELDL